jgi:hypothetical protein
LGRYLPSGDIVCLGRADDQVKIRGFRIELGEVNTTLNSHDLVKETVTIVRNDIIEEEKHIVSYIVLKDKDLDKKIVINELRSYLKSKLPTYMIPTAIVILNALPLTPNGKIKVAALPKPEQDKNNEKLSSRNETDKKLIEIWKEVLNLKNIGINENFFDIGGHSINSTTILFKSREIFKIDIPVEGFLFNKKRIIFASNN